MGDIMESFEVEVELRPSRGVAMSAVLNRPIEVESSLKTVWFRVVGETDWISWGNIDSPPGSPLNWTNQLLNQNDRKVFGPLVAAKVAELRGENIRVGGIHGFSSNPIAVVDEDEDEIDDADELSEAGIIEEA